MGKKRGSFHGCSNKRRSAGTLNSININYDQRKLGMNQNHLLASIICCGGTICCCCGCLPMRLVDDSDWSMKEEELSMLD